MKFMLSFNWKLGAFKAGLHKQQLLRRRRQTAAGSKEAAAGTIRVAGVTASDRKAKLIRHTCAEFVAQMELLHAQLDKQPKFLAKSTKANFMYDGSFHEAVGKVLLVAECFAVMPVKGVTNAHPSNLSFAWTNVRTLYSLIFIVVSLIDAGLAINKVLNRPMTFNNIEPLIFRLCIIVTCSSALSLARKWPSLMACWHEIESDLPPYVTQMEKGRLARRIKMVTLVAMMLSLGEHLMKSISLIHYANNCFDPDEPMKNFLILSNEHIFTVFPYSSWLGILGKVENTISTFVWNYMDVFVMVVGIGLASKFQQLNDNLMKFKGMQMAESFWSERRIQYRNLCMLCERMDDAVSLITMVSFSNNLFFICMQLLRSLNTMPSAAHTFYFYYSLIFLFGRTLAVSLYSASVHDESQKPLRMLRCVPRESWCAEVKRFSDEISTDLVALSGMKFFHLTRKLVLSVAGTIVTYELVLIQFHQDNKLFDCSASQRSAINATNTSATH